MFITVDNIFSNHSPIALTRYQNLFLYMKISVTKLRVSKITKICFYTQKHYAAKTQDEITLFTKTVIVLEMCVIHQYLFASTISDKTNLSTMLNQLQHNTFKLSNAVNQTVVSHLQATINHRQTLGRHVSFPKCRNSFFL